MRDSSRRPQFVLAVLSLLAILAASRAQAQSPLDGMESQRLISIGLGGGLALPTSDAKEALERGFAGQGFVRLNLRMLPVAPRLDFTFQSYDLKSATLTQPGTGSVLAGMANFQLPLIPGGPVRPYLVAGVGAYQLSTEPTGEASTSDVRFGLNGGAGVLFKLGSVVSGYIEGRVDNVYTEAGAITADQILVIPITFGIVF